MEPFDDLREYIAVWIKQQGEEGEPIPDFWDELDTTNQLAHALADCGFHLDAKTLTAGPSVLGKGAIVRPHWISVTDHLPESDQYVLTLGGRILRVPLPARIVQGKEGIEFWWATNQIKPTHWMPLPMPPQEPPA